jgi:hypothetical protein
MFNVTAFSSTAEVKINGSKIKPVTYYSKACKPIVRAANTEHK